MKKIKRMSNKIAKIFLLIAIVISDLTTPISVLADTLSNETEPEIGSIRLNDEISTTGSVTVTEGSLTNEGDVQVTKTVSKTDTLGKYKVEFEIKGKDRQDVIENKKPLYLVVVFDTSGSMICDSSKGSYAYDNYDSAYNIGDWDMDNEKPDYGYGQGGFGGPSEFKHIEPASYEAADGTTIWCSNASKDSSYILDTKWENAVSGAISFSSSLSDIDNTYISLVTFANSATTATTFEHRTLTEKEFGHPVGSTNLKQGIENAQAKLDTIKDKDVQKYILVIGDGEPTAGSNNPISAAKTAASNAKEKGTKIFSIGYGITAGSDAEKVLMAISSNTDIDTSYYQLASVDGLTSSLKTVFKSLGDPKKAGTNATLTDNVGGSFSIVDKEGQVYTSQTISEITETGTKMSFFIEIDPDSETGWHNTNDGFNLVYTDSNGVSQTISSDENPEVYWVQNKYNYTVNYYKDEITNKTDSNYLGSKSYEEVKGTVITSNEVDKTLFIPEGYEFNQILFGNNNETSITITNDNSHNEINVLYTIKKFNYKVNYYYDDVLDNSKTISDIPYNTTVDSTTHYLSDSVIKEGYILDTTKSDNQTFTIKDNTTEINIYYEKNSYSYKVEYYFNGIFDNTFTYNNSAVYGSSLYAKNYNLSQERLSAANKGDYFLNPTKPYDPSEITIGVDGDSNIIKVYYVNTYLKENTEKISKETKTNKVTTSNQVVNYKVNYQATVKNVNKDTIVTTTIVDTLPYKITNNSNLTYNGNTGIYDEENKTITWTITTTIDKYYEEYNINETIEYSVIYKDFEEVSALTDNTLVNTVKGFTRIDNKLLSEGVEDTAKVEVLVKGNLIVKYLEKGTNKELATSTTTTEKVGSTYTTTKKTIFGYKYDSVSGNETGKYKVNDTTVIYYYTKNAGTIEEPKITKTGPSTVDSINNEFDYQIKASASIKEYVGKATLKVTDTLPYKIDTTKSVYNQCSYDGEYTITCEKEYNIKESDYVNGVYTIDETFDLKLVFIDIDSETVVNEASSTVKLDTKEETTETTTTTDVEKGYLVVVHKDENGKVLETEETKTALAGTPYTTTHKDTFHGYTYNENKKPTNANGVYIANEAIEVVYYYSKNIGTAEEDLVKRGSEKVEGIDSEFNYTITYNTYIKDYNGKATITIIDTLPYEIDLEKSEFSNKCVYSDGKITCEYEFDITKNERISISEDLKLYYIGIDSEKVTNKVKSILTYGEVVENNYETTTIIQKGNVTINYVTIVNGEYKKLTDSIQTSGLVGSTYTTTSKEFEGYTLTDVVGEEEGIYTEEEQEVTYIYKLKEVPPKTGVEVNPTININFLSSLLVLLIGIILRRKI